MLLGVALLSIMFNKLSRKKKQSLVLLASKTINNLNGGFMLAIKSPSYLHKQN